MLSYLPSYKFSQDHLEIFFSNIRSHGGWNPNPSTIQFKAAFKKSITHIELSAPNTGNCMPVDEILHVTSGKTPLQILNNDAPSWTDVVDIDEDPNLSNATQFSRNVIVYIAGFVVRSIKKKLQCLEWLEVLLTTPTDVTYHSLIKMKTRGSLIHPSSDVVYICTTAERVMKGTCNNEADIIKFSRNKEKILNEILRQFVGTNIFQPLHSHTRNQDALYNHRFQLIKLIIQSYVKIRMYHLIKLWTTKPSERQFYTKLILFKGQ